MSTIPKIDFLLLEMTRDTDIILPSVTEHEKQEKYPGAIVLEPDVGLHENVIVVDFRSLYPACYTTYNISPETVHTLEEYEKLEPIEELVKRIEADGKLTKQELQEFHNAVLEDGEVSSEELMILQGIVTKLTRGKLKEV